MPIRLALVDDYEVVVRGLTEMLRAHLSEIDIVELNADAPVSESVDIALYDTFAQPQGDKEGVRRLAANPRVGKVVVFTWNFDPDLARTTLANGASGYLSKALPASALMSALRAVQDGEQVVSPDPGRKPIVAGDWPGREEGLTAREAEVLALITQGLSNAEIADLTSLSINSIKSYIRTCYRKIGVKNRSNAVLWGVEHGFRPDRLRIRNPEVSGQT